MATRAACFLSSWAWLIWERSGIRGMCGGRTDHSMAPYAADAWSTIKQQGSQAIHLIRSIALMCRILERHRGRQR